MTDATARICRPAWQHGAGLAARGAGAATEAESCRRDYRLAHGEFESGGVTRALSHSEIRLGASPTNATAFRPNWLEPAAGQSLPVQSRRSCPVRPAADKQLCCWGVLVATNRTFGLVTASQIASASTAYARPTDKARSASCTTAPEPAARFRPHEWCGCN